MNCDYCGTPIDENGYVESGVPSVNGPILHTSMQCREYVYAVLRSYKREAAELRERVAEYENAIAGALGSDHPSARCGTPLERVSALARMVDEAERRVRGCQCR